MILDCNHLENIPRHAEIKHPFQLIEGHSRMGYAKASKQMAKKGKGKLAETHKAFIVKLI